MCPNPEFSAELVTFTEKILNGKLHFLWSMFNTEPPFINKKFEIFEAWWDTKIYVLHAEYCLTVAWDVKIIEND